MWKRGAAIRMRRKAWCPFHRRTDTAQFRGPMRQASPLIHQERAVFVTANPRNRRCVGAAVVTATCRLVELAELRLDFFDNLLRSAEQRRNSLEETRAELSRTAVHNSVLQHAPRMVALRPEPAKQNR